MWLTSRRGRRRTRLGAAAPVAPPVRGSPSPPSESGHEGHPEGSDRRQIGKSSPVPRRPAGGSLARWVPRSDRVSQGAERGSADARWRRTGPARPRTGAASPARWPSARARTGSTKVADRPPGAFHAEDTERNQSGLGHLRSKLAGPMKVGRRESVRGAAVVAVAGVAEHRFEFGEGAWLSQPVLDQPVVPRGVPAHRRGDAQAAGHGDPGALRPDPLTAGGR